MTVWLSFVIASTLRSSLASFMRAGSSAAEGQDLCQAVNRKGQIRRKRRAPIASYECTLDAVLQQSASDATGRPTPSLTAHAWVAALRLEPARTLASTRGSQLCRLSTPSI